MTVNNSAETDQSQSPNQPAENVEAEVLEKQVASPVETDTSTKGVSGTEQPTKDSVTVEDSFMGKEFDPKSLEGKPELEKAYKSFQGAFTQKTQGIAGDKAELEQLRKWQTDLNAMPEFQQFSEDITRMAKMQQAGQKDISNMTEQEKFDFAVDEKLKNYIEQKVDPRVKTLEQERATARVDKFLATNPAAKEYAVKISNIMKQHPTLDMDTAWKLLKADFAKDDAKKEVLSELEVKGDANLELPGKQASQPAKKAKMTVEEAAELAERQTGYKFT